MMILHLAAGKESLDFSIVRIIAHQQKNFCCGLLNKKSRRGTQFTSQLFLPIISNFARNIPGSDGKSLMDMLNKFIKKQAGGGKLSEITDF